MDKTPIARVVEDGYCIFCELGYVLPDKEFPIDVCPKHADILLFVLRDLEPEVIWI